MYTPGFIKRENQYTYGTEYMFNGEPYVGYYNMTALGPYSQGVFDKGRSEKIYPIRYVPNENAKVYVNLADNKGYKTDLEFDDPVYSSPLPEKKDYLAGYFLRYFIKQRNDREARILEIDKDQYDKLIPDSGINPSFYKGVGFRWKLKGPKNDILAKNNTILRPGIEDTNRRTVNQYNRDLVGLNLVIGNRLTKYSEYDANDFDKNNSDLRRSL